jgi:hypothetical protein
LVPSEEEAMLVYMPVKLWRVARAVQVTPESIEV